jgi:2-polyprenyl-3-methyl-5-hydroxy-6-metoxy-1,4-benzoquinol methylase
MYLIGGIDLSFFKKEGKKKSLLDFGSGNGKYAVFFIKKGFDVVAVDINPDSETCIKNQLRDDEKKKITFFRLDAEKDGLQFDRQFDYIICREVLEHIKNYEKVLQDFYRLLKPGGMLILSVPTSFTERYFYFWDKKWLKKCGHVNIFKRKEIIEMCKKYNLDFIKLGKHSFRRTIFWSLVTPFKINHDMGKISSHYKLAKCARFVSDCICYFRYFEKIGNYLLPKSNVFYFKKRV